MKRQLLTGALLLLACAARSQTAGRQVLGTTGGSYTGSGFAADYTSGDLVNKTAVTGSFTLTQGFQQPASNPVGIREVRSNVQFLLYPNPAVNTVILELSSSTAATLSLSVSNISGQRVYGPEQLSVQNSFKQELTISDWASGIYFVNLSDLHGTLVQSIKFEKQ